MQINNSSASLQIQPLEQANRPAKGIANADRINEQNAKQQRVDRIDIDENAISLLEQEKQSNSNSTSYDQPSQQNATAVSVYQSVGNLEQRENVQQLLGVDLFA